MPVGAGSTHLVTYRSYRDLYQDEHEGYFTIRIGDRPGTSPERLTATLILPIGKSIQQQLLEFHMSNRQGTLESLMPRVLVQRLDVAQDRCPVLRARVEALPRLSISVSDRNVIFHHHVIHRLVIDTGSDRVDARLVDPESSAVRWAVETFKAIKACEGA